MLRLEGTLGGCLLVKEGTLLLKSAGRVGLFLGPMFLLAKSGRLVLMGLSVLGSLGFFLPLISVCLM